MRVSRTSTVVRVTRQFLRPTSTICRATTAGHQADKDRKGVSMQQGFTQASFKYAFVGNLPAQVEALRPKKQTSAAATPKTSDLETMAKSTHDDFESMIHRPHFDLFRCLMHFSQEGVLKDYHFDKIEECPLLPVVPDPTISHLLTQRSPSLRRWKVSR